jgi:L-lactate dehydrogenase complex protein LldG
VVTGPLPDVVADYTAAATANTCRVHGPLAGPDAVALVTALVAGHGGGPGGARAAVAEDELTAALGIARALADAGTEVLRADDPAWRDELMVAAVGVTGAALAVAETGSLVVTPGPGAPRATSLAPPVHVCLVATPTIVATVEDAVLRLASLGPDALPSAITWVGGPSRTSDLEMRPTFGIHGPRTVEVVLVQPGGAHAER